MDNSKPGILHNVVVMNLWNQFGPTSTGGMQKLKSVKKTPEMKRSRGVHSRRAQEHYPTSSRCEVIDFQKLIKKRPKKITEM